MNNPSDAKIAVLLAGLNVAGIQRIRVALIQQFVQCGFKVDVFCRSDDGPLRRDIPNGVKVYVGGRFGYLFRLLKYLKKEKPTHLLSSYEDITLMAIAAIRLSKHKPFLLSSTHNSLMNLVDEGNLLRRWKFQIVLRLMRHMYRYTDALVAVSSQLADDLSEVTHVPKASIAVIYNPVTPRNAPFMHADDRLSSDGQKVIGFFGRLHEQKRVDLLLRAFALITCKLNCYLWVFGEGQSEMSLRQLVKDLEIGGKVKFHDFLSNPYPAMTQCSVIVLPSDYEGFGNVLIEAMACGTQVISTDCPHGPYEILEGGKWGQLVPCNDVDALSDALYRSLTGSFYVSTSSLMARASEFSLERATAEYLRMLGLRGRV